MSARDEELLAGLERSRPATLRLLLRPFQPAAVATAFGSNSPKMVFGVARTVRPETSEIRPVAAQLSARGDTTPAILQVPLPDTVRSGLQRALAPAELSDFSRT